MQWDDMHLLCLISRCAANLRTRYLHIADTYTSLGAAVLGGEATLKMLVEPLGQLGAGSQDDWRTPEAALFCIRCVPGLHSSLLLVQGSAGTQVLQYPSTASLRQAHLHTAMMGLHPDLHGLLMCGRQGSMPGQRNEHISRLPWATAQGPWHG